MCFAGHFMENKSVHKNDRACPGCSAMVGIEFSFCGACGNRVSNTVAASA
ncbi:hypothetical protein PF003_g30584 [Phytophthora fragariae]|nr:hypothetical protein PF003_g30584 [Phytophthora fragariae]